MLLSIIRPIVVFNMSVNMYVKPSIPKSLCLNFGVLKEGNLGLKNRNRNIKMWELYKN